MSRRLALALPPRLLELAMSANRAPQRDVVLLYRVVSGGSASRRLRSFTPRTLAAGQC